MSLFDKDIVESSPIPLEELWWAELEDALFNGHKSSIKIALNKIMESMKDSYNEYIKQR